MCPRLGGVRRKGGWGRGGGRAILEARVLAARCGLPSTSYERGFSCYSVNVTVLCGRACHSATLVYKFYVCLQWGELDACVKATKGIAALGDQRAPCWQPLQPTQLATTISANACGQESGLVASAAARGTVHGPSPAPDHAWQSPACQVVRSTASSWGQQGAWRHEAWAEGSQLSEDRGAAQGATKRADIHADVPWAR